MANQRVNTEDVYILVTGANSGVGFAICCRLIDEFFHTHPQSSTLHLTITTRSTSKSDSTLTRLRQYQSSLQKTNTPSRPGLSQLLESRVTFDAAALDLTSLSSVRDAASVLHAQLPRLDVIILNAGIGGWTGVDWPRAIWGVCTDLVNSTTWPTFNKSAVGRTTAAQQGVIEGRGGGDPAAPPVGEVFCANVFGHYMLVHYLAPLLHLGPERHSGRIIWQGSVSVYASGFSLQDIQGLDATDPYDSSKRLTDILALTAGLPSTARSVRQWLALPSTATTPVTEVRSYVCHPGICSTGIMPLPYILTLFMALALYAARWLGSIWHPITAYKGAVSAVWLALSEPEVLDDMERRGGGPGKWGSAADVRGNESVERTDVEGWGWGGVVGRGGRTRKGRRRDARDLTPEAREDFEVLAQQCWREMEALRLAWEKRLGGAGNAKEKLLEKL